jgi:hypothetical protein
MRLSLHRFFAHWPNQLAFIKMDVGGAEASILERMERILKTDRPLLLIEVYGFDIHGMNHPALACLQEAGYSFSLLDMSAVQGHILAGQEPEEPKGKG